MAERLAAANCRWLELRSTRQVALDPGQTVDVALVLGPDDRRRELPTVGALRTRWPSTPVVIMVNGGDHVDPLGLLRLEASGYVDDSLSAVRLRSALEDALDGGVAISARIGRALVASLTAKTDCSWPSARATASTPPPVTTPAALTPHERRLLGLLGDGISYKDAALRLRCSVNTVSFHVRNIYRKLRVHSKAHAVAEAMRRGLI